MSSRTYFSQDCPTCGRKLRIRVEYLGKLLVCQHCNGRLRAREATRIDEAEESSKILKRANELIASVEHRREVDNSHDG